jgi:hypothetical protein
MENNNGTIKFKKGSKVVELIQKMGSKNRQEANAALDIFAAFIGPVIQLVVEQAPVISNLYETEGFVEGTTPSLPLDVYYDVRGRDYIQVWSQALPGGLATNEIKGLSEMFVPTYELNSAVSFDKKYARESRLDVVAASMTRMAQEILVGQELISANVMLAGLAQSRYDSGSGNLDTIQITSSNSAGAFTLDDFNTILVLLSRIRPSTIFAGTPVNGNAVNVIVGSPEFCAFVRSIAYQPVNTRNGATVTQGASSLAAPESVREMVWSTAGIPSFFGVDIVQAYEFGVNKRYNTVFSKYMGSQTFPGYAGVGTQTFSPTTQQVVMFMNTVNAKALVRMVEEDSTSGGRVVTQPDDSFNFRSNKLGFYSNVKEGRVVLDGRYACGLVI